MLDEETRFGHDVRTPTQSPCHGRLTAFFLNLGIQTDCACFIKLKEFGLRHFYLFTLSRSLPQNVTHPITRPTIASAVTPFVRPSVRCVEDDHKRPPSLPPSLPVEGGLTADATSLSFWRSPSLPPSPLPGQILHQTLRRHRPITMTLSVRGTSQNYPKICLENKCLQA